MLTPLNDKKTLEDGIIGPQTLALVKQENRIDIINEIAEYREDFYRSLGTFDTFGRGWLRRNEETKDQAVKMA